MNIEGLTTLEAETILLEQLNDFNCSTIDLSYNTVQLAYSKILLQTSNGENVYGSILDVSNTNLMKYPTYAVYDSSHSYIKNTYNNEILGLRSELDMKLKELNNNTDSISNEYKNRFDSTIYSGLMVTVLATSMIYYLFTKV